MVPAATGTHFVSVGCARSKNTGELMAETTMKGHRLRGGVRPSRTVEGQRTCARPDCTTRLSRYNTREGCNSHAPVTYPRVRGRFVDEA